MLSKKLLFWIFLIGFISGWENQLFACNVPVFRYALERWPADRYEFLILQHGTLTSKELSTITNLKKYLPENEDQSNFQIKNIDLSRPQSKSFLHLWEKLGQPQKTHLVIRTANPARIIWSGSLSDGRTKMLLDSPVRQKIADKLQDGAVAVWLFLAGGNQSFDSTRRQILQTHLNTLEKTLSFAPQQKENLNNQLTVEDSSAKYPIRFPLIEISRTDSAETFLRTLLLKSEPDLAEYSSLPMAFPVYGRGRALYTLIGKGINPGNIQEACKFLIGPCSCEIKALNQGFDLLIHTDWSLLPVTIQLSSESPPVLKGLSTFLPNTETAARPQTETTQIFQNQTDSLPSTDSTGATNFVKTQITASESLHISETALDDSVKSSFSPVLRNIIIVILTALGVVVIATLVNLSNSYATKARRKTK